MGLRGGSKIWGMVVGLLCAVTGAVVLAGPPGARAAEVGRSAMELYSQGYFARAYAIWQQQAEAGDPEAQFNLSVLLERGRGVDRDLEAALSWLGKAASGGYPPALHNMALGLLEQGEGEAAVNLLRQADEKGFAASQYTLGKMYEYGLGVDEAPDQALFHILKAAAGGYPKAQYGAGKMYRDGYGGREDPEQARQWFLRAARQGYGRAQLRLAEIGLSEGELADDPANRSAMLDERKVEALQWAIIAAAQRIPGAETVKARLAARLKTEQVVRAVKLAEEYKPMPERRGRPAVE
ncbi:tetratricopeptide repeat protein [Sneathiella chinensis]|uniref:Sel1 repeat family protein n=1 Tax=Sneathiella chinensis TaxID=349750 RepID=A0ABQ5U7K1_9PROT|nr:tetratricopeptide repeat protein [Sneathiella chinensis]GLQ07287.1 hypothetical protein GCM10007924_25080 [Sneathiella chinensis]